MEKLMKDMSSRIDAIENRRVKLENDVCQIKLRQD